MELAASKKGNTILIPGSKMKKNNNDAVESFQSWKSKGARKFLQVISKSERRAKGLNLRRGESLYLESSNKENKNIESKLNIEMTKSFMAGS